MIDGVNVQHVIFNSTVRIVNDAVGTYTAQCTYLVLELESFALSLLLYHCIHHHAPRSVSTRYDA